MSKLPSSQNSAQYPINYAHYKEFVRSKTNLREVIEREELLAQIKADGGVLVPGYVYSEAKNVIDFQTKKSLKVIYDMNSRHWCLEQLENDQEYIASGGSFDLPYLVLPDEIADDPVRERMLMISLGTSNKQLTPKEVGKGYMEALELKLELLKSEFQNWAYLGAEAQRLQEKKFKTQIIKQIVAESGKSQNEIYKIFRVFGSIEDNPELGDCVEKDLISISCADEVLKVSDKLGTTSLQLLEVAKKVSFDRGSAKVTEKDVAQAARIFKHPEICGYVSNGSIPTTLVEDVLNTAAKVKTDISELVEHSQSFGGVTKENLDKVAEALIDTEATYTTEPTKSAETKSFSQPPEIIEEIFDEEEFFDEEELSPESFNEDKVSASNLLDETKEIKKETEISKKQIIDAKELISELLFDISDCVDRNYPGMSAVSVLVMADKLDKLHKFILRNSN